MPSAPRRPPWQARSASTAPRWTTGRARREPGSSSSRSATAWARTLSAEESILVPLLALGVPAREASGRVDDVARLGSAWPSPAVISSTSSPAASSSGWRWPGPSPCARHVLLADESTSDLDADNRGLMIAALREEAARGASVVLATHDPDAAAETDGTLALDEGVATWVRTL